MTNPEKKIIFGKEKEGDNKKKKEIERKRKTKKDGKDDGWEGRERKSKPVKEKE